jgi:hypothetical protein
MLLLPLALLAGCSSDQTPSPDGPLADGPAAQELGPGPDRHAVGEDPVRTDRARSDGGLHADAAPLRDDALALWTWHDQAVLLADRASLGAAFAAAGYSPPDGTFLLAARVVAGLGQPAFQYFSLGDSGIVFSAGKYWPASTVKLTAAVGALRTLGSYGLTGAAQVSFSDDDGSYSGTVKNLYSAAIEVSDNVAYNRLMELAGFDTMNDTYLVAAESFPEMVLQRRYTHPLPTSDLRHSPAISYSESGKTGTIPARVGTGQHPTCPDEANCITLLELTEVLRRVVLDSELPAIDRFPLGVTDVANLQGSLLTAPTKLDPGASSALGHPVKVYNKTGDVPGDDRLDHGLIVDTVDGRRFLFAASMPYDTTSDTQMSELAKRTLQALLAQPTGGLALQRAAGVPITVQLDDLGAVTGGRKVTLTVAAPGADSLDLFVDGYPLAKPAGPSPTFTLTQVFSKSGDRLLVVRAIKAGVLVGYRPLVVHINT